jgi:hypothetical protein
MRVGVIRGDVPSPIFLADLEPTSQMNWPTEPVGQSRYVSRPNPTTLTNFLAGVYSDDSYTGSYVGEDGNEVNNEFTVTVPTTSPIPLGSFGYGGVPAGVQSSAAVTFPVTISGANDTLTVKNSSGGSPVTVTVASGSYATMSALLTAINAVLSPTGLATAVADATGTLVVIQSTVPGVGSYIDVTGGTLLASINMTAGQTFTMPSATTIIAALNPVVTPPATGSIDVSAATLLATLGASPAAANVAQLIAPQFAETEAAVQSFQVGNLSKYLELTWNPNPRALPAITSGPAIQVVQDDGHTPFSAPLPMITAAVHNSPNAGDITITGVGLGNSEYSANSVQGGQAGTVVMVRQATSAVAPGSGAGVSSVPSVNLPQRLIAHTNTGGTQGSVSATSIVIPASLLTTVEGVALGVAGSTVDLKYETFSNGNYGTAATVSSVASQSYIGSDGSLKNHQVVTMTGLSNMQVSAVGTPITISGAATAANNGTFIIQSVPSSSSVTFFNDSAVAPDANNGAISWSQGGPVLFPVT